MTLDPESDSPEPGGPPPIQAIVNAVDAIDFISRSNRGVGVRELARELRLTRGTAERVLYSLLSCGLARRDSETGRFFVGQRILELASQHQRSLSIGEIARRHMNALAAETGESVFLGVLDRDHVTIVDRIDSLQPLRIAATLGMREPLYCTALGKIMMANLPKETCHALLEGQTFERFTPKTLTSASKVLKSIQVSAQRGWSIDDEEFHEGGRCVAAAIFDHENQVVAAISLSGPTFRVNDAKLPQIAKRVTAAATAISRDLGHSPRAVGSGSA